MIKSAVEHAYTINIQKAGRIGIAQTQTANFIAIIQDMRIRAMRGRDDEWTPKSLTKSGIGAQRRWMRLPITEEAIEE